MKLWISLSILALVALAFIFMQDENHSLFQAASAPKLAPIATVRSEAIPQKYRPIARPAKQNFVSRQDVVEQEPAAEVDNRPDLLTWSKRPQLSSDSMANLQDTEADRTECPILMVTYGDSPTTNVKVEQRKAGGKNFDRTGCPGPSSDFLVSKDQ